jgi:hypothetical protein
MYDEWRRERAAFGLRDLFGADRPPKRGDSRVLQHEFGKGRAAYVPRLVPAVAVSSRTAFTLQYWAPPRNSAQFIQALEWAGRNTLAWHIQAPPNVAAEACYQRASGRYVLHLVNYDGEKQPRVENIRITLKGKPAAQTKKIVAYSPDEQAPLTLKANAGPDGLSFTLPRLGIYSMVTIE